MTYAVITSPSNQTILTDGTAQVFTAYAPDDTAVDLYKDGVFLAAMTSAGSGNYTYSWTPSAVASSVVFHAVGDVWGAGATMSVTVAETNTVDTDITTWSKSNAGITITGGQTDPFGGSNAYLVTLPVTSSTSRGVWKTASSTPTEVLNGFEMWVKPYGGIDKFYIPTAAATAKGVYIDLTNKNTKTNAPCGAIVEQIGDWYRIQITKLTGATTSDTFYWYFCQTFGSITLNIASGGTSGAYFYAPRMVGTVKLPFTDYQKLQWYYSSSASGVDTYNTRHEYLNTAADYDSATSPSEIVLRVIKPAGWDSGKKYRCLIALPALSDALEGFAGTTNATQAMVDGDFADTYNLVVIIVYDRSNSTSYWWASNSDGSNNGQDYVADIITQWAEENLAVSTSRDDKWIIGYSKSAWAGMSMMLRRPDKIGGAVLWDGNYNQVWNAGLLAGSIDTSAQFDAFNPLTIMAANAPDSIGDTRRVVVTYGNAWTADYTAMLASLNTNDVNYYTANSVTPQHAWLTSWTTAGVAALVRIMNKQYSKTSLDSASSIGG